MRSFRYAACLRAIACLRITTGLLLFIYGSAFAQLEPQSEPLPSAVNDLRYGVALYNFYREKHMDALSELLVAEARGGIKGHGDNPEIMEGGFALAYGMEKHAGDIFHRLLRENRSITVRDAAWFYIGRLRYLRQDWQGASEAISFISEKPSDKIKSDLSALKINLAIRQGRLEDAAEMVRDKRIRPEEDWMPYMYFNLGSAWARQNEFDRAIGYFNQLNKRTYLKKEHQVLFDKAMTAAGYSFLLSERYSQAIDAFTRVRLTSNFANRALLGYGWAAAELGDFKTALKPWTHLSELSLVDENSQEALVAVPYAYDRLGAEGLALQYFQRAEEKFLQELDRLENVIQELTPDRVIEILEIERSRGIDWLRNAKQSQITPQLSYLANLFAQQEFQSVVQDMRDLLAVQEDLRDWRTKLVFYRQIVEQREFDRQARAAELNREQAIDKQITELKNQRDSLSRELARIRREQDPFALLQGDEADLAVRAKRSLENVELLGDSDPFADENRVLAQRYFGILLWRAEEQFIAKTWQVEKQIAQIDRVLDELTERNTRIESIASFATDLGPMKEQIDTAQARINDHLEKIQASIDRSKITLREQIIAVLEQQQVRLNHYLAQSRLSIARMYDKANLELGQ